MFEKSLHTGRDAAERIFVASLRREVQSQAQGKPGDEVSGQVAGSREIRHAW